MHNPKIDQLLEFLNEDPNDPFTLYALALEYEKQDEGETKKYYDLLLNGHPEYLATYYHAAKFYEKLDRTKAEEIYRSGMTLAMSQRKMKPYQELQNALNLLMEEED